jgi:hypothetical protein
MSRPKDHISKEMLTPVEDTPESRRHRAKQIIASAEGSLGKLSDESKVNLLLDQMPELSGVGDAERLIETIT